MGISKFGFSMSDYKSIKQDKYDTQKTRFDKPEKIKKINNGRHQMLLKYFIQKYVLNIKLESYI